MANSVINAFSTNDKRIAIVGWKEGSSPGRMNEVGIDGETVPATSGGMLVEQRVPGDSPDQ